MAKLKEYSYQPNCEVEINLKLVNDQSVRFQIYLRYGKSFPVIHSEIACLKRDFLKLLDDLKHIDSNHLSMLEFHDPGLYIYHVPQYGPYYYPGFGFLHIPEEEREERDSFFRLIFVLDASLVNDNSASECGPALCLRVKMEQINEFVESLKLELNSF